MICSNLVEYGKTSFSVRDAVKKAPFVSICTDGYTDRSGRHVYNVICLTPTPFLWTTVETTTESETIAFLSNLLKKEVEKIGPEKVMGIITDHAANIRGAANQLKIDYPWLIVEGCKAHLLNLLAKDICEKSDLVKSIIKKCSLVTSFFQ